MLLEFAAHVTEFGALTELLGLRYELLGGAHHLFQLADAAAVDRTWDVAVVKLHSERRVTRAITLYEFNQSDLVISEPRQRNRPCSILGFWNEEEADISLRYSQADRGISRAQAGPLNV